MGEIADMMMEGQMCQGCGEIMGDGDGYPVFCDSCQEENGCDEHGEKIKTVKVVLGKKFVNRLMLCRDLTDRQIGMYAGDYLESAPTQYKRLCDLGFAAVEEPHNQVHKDRVVITNAGREYLKVNYG